MISPEVKQILDQAVIALFTIVILPTIPLVYKILKAWMEAKVARINDEGTKAAVVYAFERLDHIVNNTVAEIAQVASRNTGLTEEDKKARRVTAYKRIRAQITDADYAVLKTAVKDIDRYVWTKIEASRYNQKSSECPPPK